MLGRVGLVVIGIVGGVVLHATWEGSIQHNVTDDIGVAQSANRRENGLEVVSRVLDWWEKTKGDTELVQSDLDAQKTLDFSHFEPQTAAALTALTDAVVRDYVE